jgi:hypothetical protein
MPAASSAQRRQENERGGIARVELECSAEMRPRRRTISTFGCDACREVRVARVVSGTGGGGEITFRRAMPPEPPRGKGAIGQQRWVRGSGAQRGVSDRVRAGGIAAVSAYEQEEGEAIGRNRGACVERCGATVVPHRPLDITGAQRVVAARDQRRRQLRAKEHRCAGDRNRRDDETA